MTASFVHLSVHSDHSLVDGTLRVKALVKAAREAGHARGSWPSPND